MSRLSRSNAVVMVMGMACAGCDPPPVQPSGGASDPTSPPSASSSASIVGPSSATAAQPQPSPSSSTKDTKGGAPIGMAKMAADGTLTITLYTRAGGHGQTQQTLTAEDPDHAMYVKHVGGLKPGEGKLIPPFPDDIDDARVDASVKAFIAKEPWAADAAIVIIGTDKQDRIAVTARARKKPTRGWSLLLDPKSYAVVDSKPLR